MPKRLLQPQIDHICTSLTAGFSVSSIATNENVSAHCVHNYASNFKAFNSPQAPSMRKLGRLKSLIPTQVAALNEWLIGQLDSYLDEIQYFLWDNFNVDVSLSIISRALKVSEITRKKLKKKASEHYFILCDTWMARLTTWTADQLIFVDESTANKHTKDHKYS